MPIIRDMALPKITIVAGLTLVLAANVAHSQCRSVNTNPCLQGQIITTGSPWDVCIGGVGFFEVVDAQGDIGFTRNGRFYIDGDGDLAVGGEKIVPITKIPKDAGENIAFSPNGFVFTIDGSYGKKIGQLKLNIFHNEAGLQQCNEIYKATAASGPPQTVLPCENGYGEIVVGALEVNGVYAPRK